MFVDEVYLRMWGLAKPYYEKGRAWDISHVEWMTGEADIVSSIESLDRKLLLPIVILHDVGYSLVDSKNPSIKSQDKKMVHMREGAKIADRILGEVNYDGSYRPRIVRYISVHDNWVLGDNKPFKECKEMAVFNDLDFLWVTTSPNTLRLAAQSMGMGAAEFLDYWVGDEKLKNRPFCCKYTREIWEKSIKKMKEAITHP